MKLLKQIQWQERQHRILGRLDVIILKKNFRHTLNISFRTLVYLKMFFKIFKNVISNKVIVCNRIAQITLKREKIFFKHKCDWLFMQF